tara:strand:- start:7528 stop:8682 length:1155 start_codon:yes stop_codon:yes gene_type:complete
MFNFRSISSLAKASVFHNTPVYVQFYITARCNLTCEQCNIIYSNADVKECNLDEINNIAENFSKMGVVMVLLTGGEPFARKDLPEIIRAFESRGIHVRMQTNGFASEEQIVKCIEAGGKDISISLDSLNSSKQDQINGQFNKSWEKAINTISILSKYLPKKNSFASLGCVLSKNNIDDVVDVIKFGTKISWFTSLVPIHVSSLEHPRGFRSFDLSLKFENKDYNKVDKLLDEISKMKKKGYLLYDSEQYLDDIKRFIRGQHTTWRNKNNGVCDSPNLYFALLPNGHFQPCCDFRLENSYPAFSKDFPDIYKKKLFRDEVREITSKCDGCMYGSYPEISISLRYLKAKIQRSNNFIFSKPPKRNWPISYDELINISEDILNAKKN